MLFKLTGLIVPKARPRVYKGRASMPPAYVQWKNQAIYELWIQKANFTKSITPSEVHVTLVGKHNRKSDGDNILGAILDALVQAEYLIDDSMMHITKVSLQLKHSKEEPYAIVELI